jgi:protein-tyrosine-phosphatase
MSFEEIAAIEPQVQFIYEVATRIKDDPAEDSFCANSHFHRPGGLKVQLRMYVGWDATDPRFKSEEAYDVVYRRVHDALPDCRDCCCP